MNVEHLENNRFHMLKKGGKKKNAIILFTERVNFLLTLNIKYLRVPFIRGPDKYHDLNFVYLLSRTD
jgi:hypothetical protein